MKKIWKIAMVVTCAAAFVFAACNDGEEQKPNGGTETPEEQGLTIETVRKAYETISQATKIEENIEIKSGALVQYTEEREYSLSEGAYTVTGSTKKLNGLDANEAYTETEIEAHTVSKADAFNGVLGLDEANVENVTVNENTLSLSVKAGREKDFLKLQTLTNADAMKATFALDETKLGEVEITYSAGTSTVTVTLTFTY